MYEKLEMLATHPQQFSTLEKHYVSLSRHNVTVTRSVKYITYRLFISQTSHMASLKLLTASLEFFS